MNLNITSSADELRNPELLMEEAAVSASPDAQPIGKMRKNAAITAITKTGRETRWKTALLQFFITASIERNRTNFFQKLKLWKNPTL